MGEHSKLSPSARHRWGACAASVREGAKYPDEPGGKAAVDGTHSHTLLEHCVKADLMDPKKWVGQTLKDHEGEFVVDAERASRVKIAIDYISERAAELDGVVVAETRVQPEHFLGRSDMSGTVDVQIISDGVLEVIDYKDGMNAVEVKGNAQLELYALGTLAQYKLPVNVKYPFDTVRMTIIQPKLTMKGMKAITYHDMPVADVLALIPTIVQQAAATDRPDAPFVPGESQCRYCAHKGACTALTTQAMTSAGITFANLDVAKEAANKDPHTMSEQQLRELVESAPLIRGLLDAAEEEALKRMKAGKPVEGLKLVRGRGGYAWIFGDDDLAEKLKKMGVPKDVIWPTKIISPAQIKKAQWEVTRAGEKEMKSLSAKQLELINKEYIKKSDGALTVAPLSDPRNAVIMDAAPLFTAVDALPSWLS